MWEKPNLFGFIQKNRIFFCAFHSFSYLYPPKQLYMKTIRLPLILLAMGVMTFISCEKEQFDQNVYNEIVDFQFLIDNVDREHDWLLTHSDTVTIINKTEDIHTVQVLTDNPYLVNNAEIAAEGICFLNEQKDGYLTTLAYTLPVTQKQAYIAAKREDGSYIGVASFDVGTDTVNLDIEVMQTVGSFTEPQPQTFTYLYEEGFPLPGDFDFNDLVLRISKSATDRSLQVDLKVTVEAVGAARSYAAAIHLSGVKYDDIESVKILEGDAMDKNYPLRRIFIDSDKTLLKGRHGEAVINLFESGHYVMNHELNSIGSIQRLFYNTEKVEREGISAKVPAVTRTYRINFKNRDVTRNLSFDQIDPFLIQDYNGGLWEIHTYRYKFAEVLKSIYNGKADYYDNHISWSIVVPKADFGYPIETMSLGTYNSKTGETFGPYTSFADWMKDHTQNQDWYQHTAYPQLLY